MNDYIYRLVSFISLFMLLLPEAEGQSYSLIRQISYEQGLPNNYVLGITQDKNGYIWFATNEGLSRYDGTRFTNYLKTSPSPLSLSGNALNCVMDDPNETLLWIGTQDAGLNCYDYGHNTFRVFRHDGRNPASLAQDGITSVCPSSDGNIWICTYNKGVDYFDKKTERFHHYNSSTLGRLFCDNILSCVDDGKGTLYIGHDKGGFTVLNLKTGKFTCYKEQPGNRSGTLPGNTVQSLCRDARGQIWLATSKGLAVFSPETRRFTGFSQAPDAITQICFNVCAIKDEVWVAPEFGGIMAVNIHTMQVRKPQTTYTQLLFNNWIDLSTQSLRYIFKDSYSNIWLGSWGHGAFMLDHMPPQFRYYRFSPLLSDHFMTNPSAMSVTEDTAGNLWIGTDGGGINIFTKDKRTGIYKQAHPGVEDNCMQTAFHDSKGGLWFGIYNGGLLWFAPGSRTPFQVYPSGKADSDVRAIYEDKEGQLWVATSNGVDVFDRDTHRFIRHIDLPDNLVRCITSDGHGNLWAGTYNGGLFIFTSAGKIVRTFNRNNGFPSNEVNQVYRDSKGTMWAGTAEGLVSFRHADFTKRFMVYNEGNGLDNTTIRSIIEDHNRNLWISTNRSICYLQPDGHFLCYNSLEGHPFGNFTDRSAFRSPAGMLYFGSMNGLYSFDPAGLLKKKQLPPLMISGLTVSQSVQQGKQGDEEIFLRKDKALTLNHTQNSFTIMFNTRDLAFTNRVEYIYKMEGLDNKWYRTNGQHAVSFHNLPAGSYRFIVRASARNQEKSSQEAALTIHIDPPFYAAWWAKTIYVLLVAAGIWWLLSFYRKRVRLEYLYASERKSRRQEQEFNEERLQFYTNITHELRTPLTLITGPIEDVEKSPTLTGRDRRTISLIRQNALRLLQLVNELLEFRKTETGNRRLRVVHGNIIRTIQETSLKYVELLHNPSVQFEMKLPDTHVIMWYDPEVLTIILDNLISNAAKYTKEGSITLSAETTPEGLFKIHVKDTGYGISPEALPHIFDRYYQEKSAHQASGTGIGLALVRNLSSLHGGEISVTSEEGKGSCFTLTLSLEATYPDAVHLKAQPEAPVIAYRPAGPEAPDSEQTEQETEGTADKPAVLIVEDNPDIRTYIAGALSEDFTIQTAENGVQGKETALKTTPDIIISDILMPEMNGVEMCRELKADVRTSHIPVILLTAKTSLEDKMEGYEAGADSYITKPFSATLLKSRIANLIAQRKALLAPIDPLLKAGRKAMEEKREAFEKSLSRLDKDFMQKMDSLIMDNLKSDKLDINFLAGELCMSNSTLYRKMKALTGLSTKEYIIRKRMQKAEELLTGSTLNINEIAEQAGFDNPVYFRQSFKKAYGMSPAEYRKNLLKPHTP